MPDFDEVSKVKARVQGRLFAIPGVHAVGVGHKLVNGQPTSEVAIMVFVVKKRPMADLTPNQVIPSEIEGIKTDVYESDVPRPYADSSSHRPLTGGAQIEPGGLESGSAGTLGFIARSRDLVPKIFGITCRHVVGVAPGAQHSDLDVTQDQTSIEFSGRNTPGSLVAIRMWVDSTGSEPRRFFAFYVTAESDTLATIAANVVGRISGTHVPGITNVAVGGQPQHRGGVVITITKQSNVHFSATGGFGTHTGKSSDVQGFGQGDRILLAGVDFHADGAAYVTVNVGGEQPSFAVCAPLAKGNLPPANANAIADAVNKYVQNTGVSNITATPGAAQVTITGAQEIECDISNDVRVGQPTARFCSRCSACCDRRIGRVVDVRMDPDAALIQLDAGLKYKAEIEEIGPISGTRPVTASQVKVRKRGSASDPSLTHGTILAVNQDGIIFARDQDHDPPDWVLFLGFYRDAFSIGPGSFSEDGDSGSAIVSEEANEIMGLLTSGSKTMTVATPIDRVMGAFDIVVETATAPNVEKTVPAQPGMSFSDTAIPMVVSDRLLEAHRAIVATEAGAELASAVEHYLDEAVRLVNSNRRVATVWHRNAGPRILQAALDSLQSPDRPIPREIEGHAVELCLRNIQNIFIRYASVEFAADLARMGPRIIALLGLSYNHLLSVLERSPKLGMDFQS